MNINSKTLLIKAKEKHVVSEGIRINCISKEIIVSIGGFISMFFFHSLRDIYILSIGIFFLYMGLGLLIVNIYYTHLKSKITQKISKESITTLMFLIPTFVFSVSMTMFFPGHLWKILGLSLLVSDLIFLFLACLSCYYYER